MDIIAQLGTLLGLSFIAGINLYATVAVVGLCIKLDLVTGLPPGLTPLANEAVIFVALLLYAVEFFADKIPGIDTLWDTLHTIIRPFGGALLALMQVGEASPAVEVVAFMLGASLASATHLTKAGTRLVVNASPEPFSNAAISLGEDVGAIGFSYLSLAYPKTTFFLTLLLLVLIVIYLPMLFRAVLMLISSLFSKLTGFFQGRTASGEIPVLPLEFDTFFDAQKSEGERVAWTGRAYAASVPGAPKFARLFLVATSQNLHVLFKRRFKIQGIRFSLKEITKDQTYPARLWNKWLVKTPQGDAVFYIHHPPEAAPAQDVLKKWVEAPTPDVR